MSNPKETEPQASFVSVYFINDNDPELGTADNKYWLNGWKKELSLNEKKAENLVKKELKSW